ncbi:MAG: protein ImuB [Verrucomicrobiota bacterium]|jgi:protein ImuB
MKEQAKTADEIHQILEILHKWGIHTLGQFASLDKDDLNARLGPEAVRLWERAKGISTRLLKLIQPPESFAESFEFEQEIETVDPLFFMLRRFLQQLALRLNAIYLVAKELTLQITFADPPQDGSVAADKKCYERHFAIPQPTNDVDLLFRMLHTHLENFKSEQPIIAVSLEAQPIKPPQQQFGLFETALRDPNQLYETLARLTALLGTNRVGTPVLEETYRPDAFHLAPFVWKLNDDQPPHRLAAASTPLPEGEGRVRVGLCSALPHVALRRFRPNASAAVLLNENEPVHIRSAQIEGEIFSHEGPYAISGNWWDETHWARLEWDVQLENGVLARCHQSESGWMLDGIYD